MNKDLAVSTIIKNKRKSNNILIDCNLEPLAGSGFFNDLWTRDGYLGCLGLLSEKDFNDSYSSIVYNYLSVLTISQREDGLIPLKIGSGTFAQTFNILFRIRLFSDNFIYKDDKESSEPTDSNPQYLIISKLYYEKTGKFPFKEAYINALKYCINNLSDNLLTGFYFNSWYDSFCINGPEIYSNVLYGHALQCTIYLIKCGVLDCCLDKYESLFSLFKKELLEKFYDKSSGLFKICIGDNPIFEVASNSLIVIYEFFDSSFTKELAYVLHKTVISESEIYSHVTIPRMPIKYLYKPFFFICMQGYHNNRIWPWTNYIYMAAMKKEKLDYSKMFDAYENSVIKNGTFYETVNNKLDMFKHIIQNSEVDFTCSAGCYLFLINSFN